MKSPFGTNGTPMPKESSIVALHETGEPPAAIDGEQETKAVVGLTSAVRALVPGPLLVAWSESPPYAAGREIGPSLPGAGIKTTEHEPPERTQEYEVMLPEDVTLKLTSPDGTELIPAPVSETVTVHVVCVLTGTAPGEQLTLTEDGRLKTSRTVFAELRR